MLCANCSEHKGTQKWVGSGGAIALVHGLWVMWCEGCVLRTQIDHAEERVAALEELRAKLKAWEADNPSRSVRPQGANPAGLS